MFELHTPSRGHGNSFSVRDGSVLLRNRKPKHESLNYDTVENGMFYGKTVHGPSEWLNMLHKYVVATILPVAVAVAGAAVHMLGRMVARALFLVGMVGVLAGGGCGSVAFVGAFVRRRASWTVISLRLLWLARVV